jgi:hypothetical protein
MKAYAKYHIPLTALSQACNRAVLLSLLISLSVDLPGYTEFERYNSVIYVNGKGQSPKAAKTH